jgi:hypothetical protein
MKVNRIKMLLAVATLSCWAAVSGFAQAQSQTNTNTSSNANVAAGSSGVKAQGQTSTSTSQTTSAQGQDGNTSTGANASASGAANGTGNANAAGSLETGTTIDAVLTKSLDSKKVKEGDEVTAKTTQAVKGTGEATIPKGSKLIGHVTKVSSRAKGDSESSLGILFDRAEIGKGRAVPIHAVIQALASARQNTSAAMDMGGEQPGEMPGPGYPSGAGASSSNGGVVGGTVNGVGHTVGNTAGTLGQTAGNVGGGAVGAAEGGVNQTSETAGATMNSTLNANSRGAIGLPGYTLQSVSGASTQGSVIESTGKNVKLDSGTQMVLRVIAE